MSSYLLTTNRDANAQINKHEERQDMKRLLSHHLAVNIGGILGLRC